MFESWPELWGGGYSGYRTTLRKFLWFRTVTGGNAPQYQTVTGKIVSFLTQRIAPIKIEADLAPIQDLHGQEAPWPPGGGKNKFDEENATIYNRWFNAVNNDRWTESDDSRSYAFECQPDTDYVVSAFASGVTIFRVGYIITALPSSSSDQPQIYSVTKKTAPDSVQIHTGNDATYIVVQLNKSLVIDRATQLQIQLGTTIPTQYAPYSNICPISGHTGCDIFDKAEYDAQATPTAEITFGTTVYGGKLTVFEDGSGQVVADMEMVEYDGSDDETWNKYTLGLGGFYISNATTHAIESYADGYCDLFPTSKNINSFGVIYGVNSRYLFFMGVFDLSGDSVTDWRSWLAANPIHVVFKSATPITIQLTPGQVNALQGANCVWIDAATGAITAQYPCDTKLYIDKKIAEMLNAA